MHHYVCAYSYNCGHISEQMPYPMSVNIILCFAGLIKADVCRCMLTSLLPSVWATCTFTCSKQYLVWLSVSLSLCCYMSLFFTEIFCVSKLLVGKTALLLLNYLAYELLYRHFSNNTGPFKQCCFFACRDTILNYLQKIKYKKKKKNFTISYLLLC